MPFPEPFLISLAKEKLLTEREQAVLIALFGKGQSRKEIADQLHVQESAISTCLSGVYKKFAISGRGPVKESRLKDELTRREKIWQAQQASENDAKNPAQLDENLVQRVREYCRQKILERHSRMRLLSGQEVGVDQLYVDVWLLAKPERKHFNTKESLLRNFDISKDRLALGKRIQRNPGFEIANDNSRLVILGKPGSGKTTFLKHLAIDWCQGQFQPEKIAVLIELRKIREPTWTLLDAISQELKLEEKETSNLLEEGQLLILMDGLDEVPTDKLRHNVQNQVKQIAEQYSHGNRFVLTCRTQIIGTIPNRFISVEVADFNPEQVRCFVQNWFLTHGYSEENSSQKWEVLEFSRSYQPDLKEITKTPVLLSLLCVVWQDSGEIPTNRSNLYKRGVNWLLSRWNKAKEMGAGHFLQRKLK